jgi:hypothetical protein
MNRELLIARRVMRLRKSLLTALGIPIYELGDRPVEPIFALADKWIAVVFPHEEAYLVIEGDPTELRGRITEEVRKVHTWMKLENDPPYLVEIPVFYSLKEASDEENRLLWTLLVIYCSVVEKLGITEVLMGLYLMTKEELENNLKGFLSQAQQLLIEKGYTTQETIELEELIHQMEIIESSTDKERNAETIGVAIARLVPLLRGYQYLLLREFILALWDDIVE